MKGIISSVFQAHKIAFTISFLGLAASIALFNYCDAMASTVLSVNIWDAIFSGRFREYFIVTLENHRGFYPTGTDVFLENFIWAIWNFPLWLTHMKPSQGIYTPLCMTWSKMFLVLFLSATGLVCYHIVHFFTENKQKSSLGFLFVIGSTTMMMAIGYASQQEIFYLFFFLLSILMTLKGNKKLVYLFLMICVSLNPFMIIFAVLVVASTEQRFLVIILKSSATLLPLAIKKIFFIYPGKIRELHFIDWFFFRSTIPAGYHQISIFAAIVFILVAIYIFCGKYSQSKKNLILYSALLMCACCIFSWQHFYRLANYLPFMVICILIKDDEDSIPINLFALMLLDISIFFFACSDRHCFNAASLKWEIIQAFEIGSIKYSVTSFWQMLQHFVKPEFHIEIFLVSFSAACMIFIFYNILKKEKIQFNKSINIKYVTFAHCAAPLCILIFFMSITYGSCCVYNIPIISEITTWDSTKSKMVGFNEGQEYKKNFTAHKNMKLKQIDFCTITWNNKYDDENILCVEVSDGSDKILFSKNINCTEFKDGGTFFLDVKKDNVKLVKGEEYVLTFKSNLTERDLPFALKQSPDGMVAASVWGRK